MYTVSQESGHLLVQGIPAIGVYRDLIKEFALYGAIEEYRLLDDYPAEEFTEVMWIKFVRIQSARCLHRPVTSDCSVIDFIFILDKGKGCVELMVSQSVCLNNTKSCEKILM